MYYLLRYYSNQVSGMGCRTTDDSCYWTELSLPQHICQEKRQVEVHWTGKWCPCCIWHHHCVVCHWNYPGCCFGKSQRFKPQGGSTAHHPKVHYALSGTAIMTLWHVLILWNTSFFSSSNYYTYAINGRGGEGHRYGISLNLCNILYEWVSSIFPVTAATITLNWQRQLGRISIWPVSDEVLKENVNL